MSKPTHILVPIGNVIDEFWDLVCGNETVDGFIAKHPKVDLSEEGIKAKSIEYSASQGYSNTSNDDKYLWTRIQKCYQQCAKDLLNTKP